MSAVVIGRNTNGETKVKVKSQIILAESADVVARYQDGNNAGHTILIDNKKYKLTMIPSGIFYTDKACVIGNSMFINPKALI